jgi:hypothetical protein
LLQPLLESETYLFVYGAFNNVISSSKKASNDGMIYEQLIENDMEGSSHGLI